MDKRFFPWICWGLAAASYFFQSGLLVLPSVLDLEFSKLIFSPFQMGIYSAAFLVIYILLQFPVGMLFDKYDSKALVAGSLAVMMMGCFIQALSYQYFWSLISRLLMGLGGSFSFVGAVYLARNWFAVGKFSKMVGFTEALSGIGGFFIIFLFAIFSFIDWRITLFFIGLALAFSSLLAAIYVRDNPYVHKHNVSILKELKQTLNNKRLWWIGIYGSFAYCHYMVIVNMWGTAMLQNLYHVKILYAVFLDSGGITGYTLGCVLIGFLNRYFNEKKLILIGIILQALVYVPIVFLHFSPYVAYVLEFIMGIFNSHIMLLFPLAEKNMQKAISGVTTGFINAAMSLSGLLMIPVVGLLYSHTKELWVTLMPVFLLQILAIPIALYFNYSKQFQTSNIRERA